ncbi:MAG: hypothetical protein QUU85_07015, partial [Candidatus Eisenbacteria bacterium]|nr:hypothetical protein [Candidatus Eisenbacteria bacterium]
MSPAAENERARIDGRTRLLALVGSPVAHSLSPRLHNHALAALDQNYVYVALDAREEDLANLLDVFPRVGGAGWNVTTPHKPAVGRLVRAGDPEVLMTGIVNTVTFRDQPIGHCTDGRGFRSWMKARGIEPGGGGIFLLGFGSLGTSLAYQLGLEFPLTIVSRDPAEAESVLLAWYDKGWSGTPVRCVGWIDPLPKRPILAVGCLPVDAGRSREVATWLSGVDPASIVVDTNYGPGRTPLAAQARDRGLTVFDGRGLLCHQAALSLSCLLHTSPSPRDSAV